MSVWVSVSLKPKAEVPTWADFQALQAQVLVLQNRIASLTAKQPMAAIPVGKEPI
jgi:hypothetical protein